MFSVTIPDSPTVFLCLTHDLAHSFLLQEVCIPGLLLLEVPCEKRSSFSSIQNRLLGRSEVGVCTDHFLWSPCLFSASPCSALQGAEGVSASCNEWCRCVDDMSTAVAESCESSQLWFTHSKALDALDMR